MSSLRMRKDLYKCYLLKCFLMVLKLYLHQCEKNNPNYILFHIKSITKKVENIIRAIIHFLVFYKYIVPLYTIYHQF